jgi:hypothetical protein
MNVIVDSKRKLLNRYKLALLTEIGKRMNEGIDSIKIDEDLMERIYEKGRPVKQAASYLINEFNFSA